MSPAAALARAEAAGVRFHRAPGGGVRMVAAALPPADVLAGLRLHREDVARLLAERAKAAFLLRAAEDAFAALAGPELGPVLEIGEVHHDSPEREAMAAFYAGPDLPPCDDADDWAEVDAWIAGWPPLNRKDARR